MGGAPVSLPSTEASTKAAHPSARGRAGSGTQNGRCFGQGDKPARLTFAAQVASLASMYAGLGPDTQHLRDAAADAAGCCCCCGGSGGRGGVRGGEGWGRGVRGGGGKRKREEGE